MTWKMANSIHTKINMTGTEMFHDTSVFLVLTATFLISLWYWPILKHWYECRARILKLASKLPGPSTLPFIGNALEFACGPDDTLKKIFEISSQYASPFRFWLGPKLFIVLTEPRDYEIILGSKDAAYKDPIYRIMEPFVGQGLVSGSGPTQRTHRKVIAPMLSNKILSSYMKYINKHSERCVQLLHSKIGEGEFNILPFMSSCTTDIILDTIMGVQGTCQDGYYKDLVHWTEKMYELVHLRMMKVWLHPECLFSLSTLSSQQKNGQRVIRTFVETVIAQKKQEYQTSRQNSSNDNEAKVLIIEQLIDHIATTNLMTDDQLRDELYTLFTAAQDTTAVISSFTFYMLAIHQDIQIKVREEINLVLGKGPLDFQHLPELKYLEMVIRETLRLFPIAPLLVRRITGDIELETCTIPEGCSVVMNPFATHRDRRFWEQPEKFVPERFLPENCKSRHPYAYIPFSGGLRSCIGQRYALMALKTIIANVIRRYHLNTSKKFEELRLKTDISVRSRDGYAVTISPI